jgi:hypothetical protein
MSSLGAVTGLGLFWVLEKKRDPHAPLKSVLQVLIIQVYPETRHKFQSFKHNQILLAAQKPLNTTSCPAITFGEGGSFMRRCQHQRRRLAKEGT